MRRRWLLVALLLVPVSAAAQGGRLDPAGVAGADSSAVMQAEAAFVRGMTRAYLDDPGGAITEFEQALDLRPGQAAVLAALAEAHQARGDLDAATFFADEAARAAPEEASTHRYLAALRLDAGDPDGAIAAYERLLATNPRDADALSALAQIQQQTGRTADALDTYGRLLGMLGESGAVRTRMLRLYRQTGDLAGAAEALEALVRLDPANRALRLQLAGLYDEAGDRGRAEAALRAVLADFPTDPDATIALADFLRQGGDDAAADALLATLSDPATATDDPETQLARAAALYARSAQDPDAAEAARQILEGVAEADAATPDALLMLGDLRFRVGAYADAAHALAAALAEDPARPNAWVQLVAAHLEAGDAAAAAEAADEALLLFPGQYPLLRVAAAVAVERGENEQARAYLDEALEARDEVAPENAAERSALLTTLALLHTRTGDADAADAAHAEALDLDPDNATALNNFAYELAKRKDRLDEALEMARRAVDLDPNPSFLDTLGWVHYARGDYDEAARWLTEAVEAGEAAGGASAVLLEHLGDAEAARGRTAEAVGHWETALARDPSREHLRRKIEEARR